MNVWKEPGVFNGHRWTLGVIPVLYSFVCLWKYLLEAPNLRFSKFWKPKENVKFKLRDKIMNKEGCKAKGATHSCITFTGLRQLMIFKLNALSSDCSSSQCRLYWIYLFHCKKQIIIRANQIQLNHVISRLPLSEKQDKHAMCDPGQVRETSAQINL